MVFRQHAGTRECQETIEGKWLAVFLAMRCSKCPAKKYQQNPTTTLPNTKDRNNPLLLGGSADLGLLLLQQTQLLLHGLQDSVGIGRLFPGTVMWCGYESFWERFLRGLDLSCKLLIFSIVVLGWNFSLDSHQFLASHGEGSTTPQVGLQGPRGRRHVATALCPARADSCKCRQEVHKTIRATERS